MKTKLLFLTILVVAFGALRAQGPQIPNGSFANWINTYTPIGWATIDGAYGESLGLAAEDTVSVAPGSVASIELMVDTVPDQSDEGLQVGLVSLGTAAFNGFGINYTGIPFIFNPDTLFFSYQYTSPGNDTAGLFFDLVSNDSGIVGSSTGFNVLLDTTSTWTQYYVLLTPYYLDINAPDTSFFYMNTVPDSLYLQFYSSIAQNPVMGSTLHIDNVYFGYANILPETVTSVGSTTFCAGDSVILSAPTDPDYSYYQWYMNSDTMPIVGANGPLLAAYGSASYYVIIDSMGFLAESTPVNVTANPPPAVSLSSSVDSTGICFGSGDVALTGTPPGGTYFATGVTDSTFTPYEPGRFAINYFYTDTNGCSAIASDTVAVYGCATGIDEAQDIHLDVYPNPASNLLNITSDKNLAGYAVQLFDVTGRMVSSQVLEGLSNSINVSSLSDGTYIFRITDNQNTLVSQNKFVVMK